MLATALVDAAEAGSAADDADVEVDVVECTFALAMLAGAVRVVSIAFNLFHTCSSIVFN